MLMYVKLTQFANISLPSKRSGGSGSWISVKLMQFAKHLDDIEFTFDGMVINFRLVQFSKAWEPIVSRDEGRGIESNLQL